MKTKSILVGAIALGAFTMTTAKTFSNLGNGNSVRQNLTVNGSKTEKLSLESTCSDSGKSTDKKSKDGKCGDGKCGDKKAKGKAKDGKCGDGKCGDKKAKK